MGMEKIDRLKVAMQVQKEKGGGWTIKLSKFQFTEK